ncbi:hypothetical protein FOA43_003167 [Brettanomyces nanus]|uniref:UBX domain-containing protein n=1 Tax=Eeniella nana TaxID=13502 RepID=A0A875S645_EENNA|nr:uncharacterized protein FOA43_003167 [Brettanomyces nanus]QPG75805.1 hypothetical protein FOA43_003167 [Brettanomyces nanus]
MDFESLIPTFLEITSTQDAQVASSYLEMSGGNLDTAVNLYFESGGVGTSDRNGTVSGSISGPGSGSERTPVESDEEIARKLQQQLYQEGNPNGDEGVRRPIQPVHEQLLSQYNYGLGANDRSVNPVERMFGSARRGIFNQAEVEEEEGSRDDSYGDEDNDNDNDNDAETPDYEYEEIPSSSDNETALTDEVVDLTGERRRRPRRRRRSSSYRTSTQKRLAKMFRPPWDIIDKLDFDSAKKKARAEKKWVLVNIQDVTDFRCQCLNRDFWSSNQIKDLVRENFVFLQYQHDSANGEMYRNLYPFSEYPHISIIDPWTGERLKMWSANPEIHKFIEQVVDFMTRFSLDKNTLNPVVQHKQKLNLDKLSEEKQIDLALKESLSEANEINDVDEVVILEGTSQKSPMVVSEPATYTEKLAQIKATDVPDPEGDAKQITRIQIRSGMDGKRIVKKFALIDPVETVFEYTKFAFKDSLLGKPFTLKMQRKNLFDNLHETILDAGLKNASILLDVEGEEE